MLDDLVLADDDLRTSRADLIERALESFGSAPEPLRSGAGSARSLNVRSPIAVVGLPGSPGAISRAYNSCSRHSAPVVGRVIGLRETEMRLRQIVRIHREQRLVFGRRASASPAAEQPVAELLRAPPLAAARPSARPRARRSRRRCARLARAPSRARAARPDRDRRAADSRAASRSPRARRRAHGSRAP